MEPTEQKFNFDLRRRLSIIKWFNQIITKYYNEDRKSFFEIYIRDYKFELRSLREIYRDYIN